MLHNCDDDNLTSVFTLVLCMCVPATAIAAW